MSYDKKCLRREAYTDYMYYIFLFSDNVHFQNSAQLIKALTEKDVYFRTQVSSLLIFKVLTEYFNPIFSFK